MYAEQVSVAETASRGQLAKLAWRSAEVCHSSDALEEAVLFVKMKELQDGAKTASDGTPPSHRPQVYQIRQRAPCRRILRGSRLTFPAGLRGAGASTPPCRMTFLRVRSGPKAAS